ncbi:MAG TPA: 30S ribosomal protein S8 [Candidatus Poseidoniales archaeon]|jgi:small subunit ribosomal protein S8|nr:30S ribosomal protein S8 [Euryarchaeota archaeon]DAC15242.1 MAG TPA: 30S ribosomal protein S8 [Candidatus Poseidoniales archaeon]|tara:strand:- start:60 stop:449 length:390 start_codon:yes stop_codon:yes gene_type:complete
MQFDPLNDALVKMFNAEQAGKYEVSLFPASKLLGSVLQIMQSQGYVGQFEKEENGRGGSYKVELLGTINQCGVVKPRYSVRRTDFDRWEGRYLPAQDFGLLILTTNNGVMSHYDAKQNRIGGRLLAYVY